MVKSFNPKIIVPAQKGTKKLDPAHIKFFVPVIAEKKRPPGGYVVRFGGIITLENIYFPFDAILSVNLSNNLFNNIYSNIAVTKTNIPIIPGILIDSAINNIETNKITIDKLQDKFVANFELSYFLYRIIKKTTY